MTDIILDWRVVEIASPYAEMFKKYQIVVDVDDKKLIYSTNDAELANVIKLCGVYDILDGTTQQTFRVIQRLILSELGL